MTFIYSWRVEKYWIVKLTTFALERYSRIMDAFFLTASPKLAQSRSRPLFRSHTVKFEIWHIPIADFYAIYHQFLWITTYKYTNTSHTLYMIGLSIKSGVLWSFWKEIWNSAKKCATLAKYGVFEALDLMKEASFHLFDTFPAKIKDKTFIWRVDPEHR